VVAVADDKYTNVARQDIRGIDIDASYQFVIGASQLMLSGLASWLESSQLNSASAPVVDLAGYVFNPPSVRARIGATWSRGRLQSAVYVNYLGSVKDNRSASEIDGKSMTTADLSLQYTLFGQSGGRKSVDLSVSVLNVANAKPPYLKSNAPYLANYDSTNYSATGRFISGSLRVRW
jgi:outer membrane receptor protein involved in Fe transport